MSSLSASNLFIIPARIGSKGIPNKNFRLLDGISPLDRAVRAADAISYQDSGIIVITTDADAREISRGLYTSPQNVKLTLSRPPELAQDGTPMINVVQHVLAQIPGPPDQAILLLQPTQPLRQPKHVQRALELLTPEVDSVVSVVELPLTHHWVFQCYQGPTGPLRGEWEKLEHMGQRQRYAPAFIRDGTCYAFWRKTVSAFGTIYGADVRSLIIPAEETCPLDTEQDWADAERRLRAQP